MKKTVLVLGGTMFIGRAFIEKLQTLPGFEITLFNRGKSNLGLFTDLEQIHGDRETDDIQLLAGKKWDVVVDFSGYYPESFQKLLKLLKGNVSRYIFISTISVFDMAKHIGKPITEETETILCSDAQRTSKLPDAYGEKKAEMERILLREKEMDPIIFRPSFIYGKYDWTERFYYWLYRVQTADIILMPDGGTPFRFSLTNSDDLVEALVQSLRIAKHRKIYHAISQEETSLREMISVASKAFGTNPEMVAPEKDRLEKLLPEGNHFPLFVPFDFRVSGRRWEEDFPFRRADMAQTFVEMMQHKRGAGLPKPAVGLDCEREQETIALIK